MRSKYLTDRELGALRASMRPRAWLPFQVALETGLRIGDVAKLERTDLSDDNSITFVAQKTGKRGRARLSAETAEALRVGGASARWFFPAPSDPSKHISRQSLWKRLKAACKRCGINAAGVSPHSMRKVFGVREYRAGGVSAAQAALQHTDIATTEIYVLADWLTEENGNKPLLRSDIARIVHYIADWLGIPKEKPT